MVGAVRDVAQDDFEHSRRAMFLEFLPELGLDLLELFGALLACNRAKESGWNHLEIIPVRDRGMREAQLTQQACYL